MGKKVNSVSPMRKSRASMCPSTTQPTRPIQTTTTVRKDTTPLRRSWPSIQMPRSVAGQADFPLIWQGYGLPTLLGNLFLSFVPRINTPFMEYIRMHTMRLQISDLAALSRALEASGD